jgi:hypothetical protein
MSSPPRIWRPPDGTYSPNKASAAYGGWQGDAQIGVAKGFGPNFSLQGAIDVDFLGDESLGYGGHLTTDPIVRLQVWANWDWGNGVRTSIGYTGLAGGAETSSYPGFSNPSYFTAERQVARAAVSYWWNPKLLTSLEASTSLQADTGYVHTYGTEAKIKFLF